MRLTIPLLTSIAILLTGCNTGDQIQQEETKKVVLVTGEKSHPATLHEYVKNVRLLRKRR